MKKLLIIIFLFLTLNVFSQDFEIGIKSGGGVNFLVSKADYTVNFIPSYTLTNSIHFNYKFSKLFFIRADFAHDRLTHHRAENYTWEEEFITNPDGKVTVNDYGNITHFLVVNDFLNLYILPGFETNGKTKFYTYAGMYFGVKVNESTLIWNEGEPKKSVTPYSKTKKTELSYGFAFGIGLKQTISKNLELSIENRLNLHDNIFANVPYNRISNNLTLGLSYKFGKKK